MPVEQHFINAEAAFAALTQRYGISTLWHITSCDNVVTILTNGLLSRHRMQHSEMPLVDISEASVQSHRIAKGTRNGLTLHDYVPLYLRARNPMLFCRRDCNTTLCLLEIDARACLLLQDMLFTDGNAASQRTSFYEELDQLQLLDWQALNVEYWNSIPDGKRKRCAEVLVPHQLPVSAICRVHTASWATCIRLRGQGINATYSPKLFF